MPRKVTRGLALRIPRKPQAHLKKEIIRARKEGFRPTLIVLLYVMYEGTPRFLLIEPTAHPGRWMPIQGGIEGKRDGNNIGVTARAEVKEEVGIILPTKRTRIWKVSLPFDLLPEEKGAGVSEPKQKKRYWIAVIEAPDTIFKQPVVLEQGKVSGFRWVALLEGMINATKLNRPEKNAQIAPFLDVIFEKVVRRAAA